MTLFIFIMILLMAVIVQMYLKNFVVPDHIGLKDGSFQKVPGSNMGISSMAIDKKFRVDPLPYSKDFKKSKEIVLDCLHTYEGMEIVEDTGNYLHIIFRSKGIKTVEDVELIFDNILNRVEYKSCRRVPYIHRQLGKVRYMDIKNKYFDSI